MKNFFTIIGGMGTMATESYIHQLNLRTPANNDQEYLNYILVNHATVPDRTAYILDNSKPNPKIPLLEDFKQQASLKPDFFTLPCNTAHYFYDELQAAKRVGIVATNGTLHDGVYDKEILDAGYELVKPTAEIQAKTMELIYDDIKEKDYVDGKLFYELVEDIVKDEKCDAVILGCTELSLAQEREPITDLPIIDSQSVLVDKTLELALKTQKNK